MPRINFYALSSHEESSRLQLACRVAEKAVEKGHQVFIQVSTEAECDRLDKLLWEFKPASFLPHALAGASDSDDVAVLIGCGDCPAGATDVLINLRSTACVQHQQFEIINEIITADPDSVATGRKSYTFYRSLGYPLDTHKL